MLSADTADADILALLEAVAAAGKQICHIIRAGIPAEDLPVSQAQPGSSSSDRDDQKQLDVVAVGSGYKVGSICACTGPLVRTLLTAIPFQLNRTR